MIGLDSLLAVIKQIYPRSLPIKDVEAQRAFDGLGWHVDFTLGETRFRAFLSGRDMSAAMHDPEAMLRLLRRPFDDLRKLQKDAEAAGIAKERATLLGSIDARIAKFEKAIALVSGFALRVRRFMRLKRRIAQRTA